MFSSNFADVPAPLMALIAGAPDHSEWSVSRALFDRPYHTLGYAEVVEVSVVRRWLSMGIITLDDVRRAGESRRENHFKGDVYETIAGTGYTPEETIFHETHDKGAGNEKF